MKSTQLVQHSFATSPRAEIQRSVFDRSHGLKTTFGQVAGTSFANQLIPIYVDEMVPGDTFSMKMHAFCRLIPTLVPIMDNLYLDFFFFAVPNRLLWTNWKKFMGEQANPGDSTSYICPVVTTPVAGFAQTDLGAMMGIPFGKAGMANPTAFAFRAYNLIWNEWFRDQNLQNSVTVNTGDGPDSNSDYALLLRGQRHDYFTSCLPLPQKATAVPIPLPSSNLVTNISSSTSATLIRVASNNGLVGAQNPLRADGSARLADAAGTTPLRIDPNGTMTVDLSTAATINQLRQSFQLQRLYERDNRGGTRYIEMVKAHFGVTSPDARLQRPEYLGGGSIQVVMNPVAQTSVAAATPQGNLAAYGTAATNGGIGFTYSATEHMTLIGLCAARADLTYQQGLDRMWTRSTRFDFYWPVLAHLGEQSVLNQEIYAQGTAGGAADAATFGYQERYAEYRYKPSRIVNAFNSNAGSPLDTWHLANKFTSLPTLNATFIRLGPPVGRVVNSTSNDPFLCDFYFQLKCARPMPVNSVPGLVDHF